MMGVMFRHLRRHTSLLGVLTMGVLLPACSGGEIVDFESPDPSGGDTGGSAASFGGSGTGGTAGAPPQGVTGGTGAVPSGNGGTGPNGGTVGSGGASPPPNGGSAGTDPSPPTGYLPARIRRLSNAEYDASIRALFGLDGSPSSEFDFPPDARQDGFSLNDAQRVDTGVARQLAASAEAIAAQVKARALEIAPCSDPNPGEACARAFIESFGRRVYRRPLTTAEIDGPDPNDGLLDLYRLGAEGATYADGIELVVRAMLQSAGFLYLTELGDGTAAPGSVVSLTPDEIAASLSFIVTGAPPDDALLAAAAAGELATPEGRAREVERLLAPNGPARDRMVRVISEWLGIDRIEKTSKDSNVYPGFDAVREPLRRESQDFVTHVLWGSTATISELLAADFTYSEGPLPQPLAQYYGVGSASGRIPLANRRGILNQGAFLSVHAHAHESAPVLRGVAVARRVLCEPVPSPTELNIVVVPPVPDPTKTTRERFAIHATDPDCQGCHRVIDSLGFSFEQYDGMGQFRTHENNSPVDSSVTIDFGKPYDGSYANSDELAVAIATMPEVRACFARHLFRASAGRSDAVARAVEEQFLSAWSKLPEADQSNILKTLIAFAEHPLFIQRMVTP